MRGVTLEVAGRRYRVADGGVDLAIPLELAGEQPAFFGAAPASSAPMRAEGFVGSVAEGGSCNVPEVHANPHCNGTHTECVGHLTARPVAIGERRVSPRPALLISVEVADGQAASGAALTEVLERLPEGVDALVVRSLPNPLDKRRRRYTPDAPAAYFDGGAIRAMVDAGIRHLVTDLPSLDANDDALLSGHRLYWGLPAEGLIEDGSAAARPEATITELAYVPDELADGLHLLELGFPRWSVDAAPSRPVLYGLEPIAHD